MCFDEVDTLGFQLRENQLRYTGKSSLKRIWFAVLLIWSTGNRFYQACVNNILSSSCYQTMPCCKIHDLTINLELESPCISIHTLINKRPLNHYSIIVWCLIQWTQNFSCATSEKFYSRSRHLYTLGQFCPTEPCSAIIEACKHRTPYTYST